MNGTSTSCDVLANNTFYSDTASHNFDNSSALLSDPAFQAQLYAPGLAMSALVVAGIIGCAVFIFLVKKARLDTKRLLMLLGVTLAASLRLTWFALQFKDQGILVAGTVIDLLQHLFMILTLMVLFNFYFIVVHSTFEHGTVQFLRIARIVFLVAGCIVIACFLAIIIYSCVSLCFGILDRLILFIAGFQIALAMCILVYTTILSVLLQRHLDEKRAAATETAQVAIVAASSVLVGLGMIGEATLFSLLVTGQLQGFLVTHPTAFYTLAYGVPVLFLSIPIFVMLVYSVVATDTKREARNSELKRSTQNGFYLPEGAVPQAYSM